jgi:hypothetical protein
MASSATLQTPHSPHIQYPPSYLLVYFYSALVVWFCSALDSRERSQQIERKSICIRRLQPAIVILRFNNDRHTVMQWLYVELEVVENEGEGENTLECRGTLEYWYWVTSWNFNLGIRTSCVEQGRRRLRRRRRALRHEHESEPFVVRQGQ